MAQKTKITDSMLLEAMKELQTICYKKAEQIEHYHIDKIRGDNYARIINIEGFCKKFIELVIPQYHGLSIVEIFRKRLTFGYGYLVMDLQPYYSEFYMDYNYNKIIGTEKEILKFLQELKTEVESIDLTAL